MDRSKSSFQPVAACLTVLAALVRLLPHPPNFAPIGSVALFGGARLRGWQAYLVPVLAMLLTDPILSHMAGAPAYSWMTPVIYGCFLINVMLGRLLIRHSNSWTRIGGTAFLGSLQFYLITNLFVWIHAADLYPRTLAGLAACYAAALPFFGRTVLGDLFYAALIFGVYSVLRNWEPNERSRRVTA